MEQTITDKVLAHYGKKGMRWGVRKELQNMPASDRSAFIAVKDKQWRDKVTANPKLDKISRKAAGRARRETRQLRADYRKQGYNIHTNALARSRYDTELKNILEHSLERAAYKVHKFPPSRLYEVQIYRHPDGSIDANIVRRQNVRLVKQFGKIQKADTKLAKVAAKAAQTATHAEDLSIDLEDDWENFRFVLTTDEEGYVTDVQTPAEALAHEDIVDKVLAHIGVKGMRWGVRKSETSILGHPTSPEPVKLRVTPGKPVKAVAGGRAHPPSQDAKAAAAYAQIARSSSSSALTNKQLQAVVTRMKLEQDWSKVVQADKAKNQTVFGKIFEKYKDQEINRISQGKTPNTILLATALNNHLKPSTGRHVKVA